MNPTLIIAAVIVAVVVGIIVIYNSFVALRNKVNEAYATMDVFLKKRFDLVPNLVVAVKGYASHEASTLETLVKQRSFATGRESRLTVDENITSALANIMVVAENYPDLKASGNFLELQQQLAAVEEDIANARRYYNGSVREFNDKCQSVPSNIVAALFGFKPMSMFQAAESDRGVVNVDFQNK